MLGRRCKRGDFHKTLHPINDAAKFFFLWILPCECKIVQNRPSSGYRPPTLWATDGLICCDVFQLFQNDNCSVALFNNGELLFHHATHPRNLYNCYRRVRVTETVSYSSLHCSNSFCILLSDKHVGGPRMDYDILINERYIG